MCDMCEGKNIQEVLIDERAMIDRFGWMKQAVGYGGDYDGSLPWMYTVGLIENFAHPELIVFGLSVNSAGWLIDGLFDQIKAGRQLEAGELIEPEPGLMFRLREVHRAHINETGTFTMWMAHYERSDLEPRALQLALPSRSACACHQQPDLALPPPRDVRADRRAWERRGRGRGRSPHPPRS